MWFYFRKKRHLRYLTGFWIHLCPLLPCAPYYDFYIYKKLFGSRYSGMDWVKFIKDSLWKNLLRQTVSLQIFKGFFFHKFCLNHSWIPWTIHGPSASRLWIYCEETGSFNHQVPKNLCYLFYSNWKNKWLSRPQIYLKVQTVY